MKNRDELPQTGEGLHGEKLDIQSTAQPISGETREAAGFDYPRHHLAQVGARTTAAPTATEEGANLRPAPPSPSVLDSNLPEQLSHTDLHRAWLTERGGNQW